MTNERAAANRGKAQWDSSPLADPAWLFSVFHNLFSCKTSHMTDIRLPCIIDPLFTTQQSPNNNISTTEVDRCFCLSYEYIIDVFCKICPNFCPTFYQTNSKEKPQNIQILILAILAPYTLGIGLIPKYLVFHTSSAKQYMLLWRSGTQWGS